MGQLSLVLKTASKPSIIIGGGPVALRKAQSLLRGKAQINVLATEISAELNQLVLKTQGQWIDSTYAKQYLQGHQLIVLIPADNIDVDLIVKDANACKIPINVYQHPEKSDFYFPYLIDRSPISIAVSSAATNPAITRIIQHKINALIPKGLGRLADFFKAIQTTVNQRIKEPYLKKRFWHYVIESVSTEAVFKGETEQAKKNIFKLLDQVAEKKNGEVFLIGAGPGDPDLLSFKAIRLLQSADVVLYDRLINPQILTYVREDAQTVYVGKAKSDHSVPQEQINQWLIDHALSGQRVIRLKGGDPFIFGRGGEEIAGLQKANIAFEVVPGITAAIGCSAYAGIPLTHRDYVQSVKFITGHRQAGSEQLNLDWPSLAAPSQTLVFYMGLTNLNTIVKGLLSAGAVASLPVALIENGTRSNQRVFTGTLASIEHKIQAIHFSGPVLTIVGEVVNLRASLDWFGSRECKTEITEPTYQ